jgi:cupin 2 domain-containing protein
MSGPHGVVRGRLVGPAGAPADGEVVRRLAVVRNLVVEEILSGTLPAPVEYVQEQDEWVALLAGRARLEVAGETHELGPGDWLLLPAGVPHTLLETEHGAAWLAVHLHRG